MKYGKDLKDHRMLEHCQKVNLKLFSHLKQTYITIMEEIDHIVEFVPRRKNWQVCS